MPKLKDLSGKRFGRLLVIKEQGRNNRGKAVWLCKCDCGNEKAVYSYLLVSGQTQSCGCLQKELIKKRSITHGQRTTKLYKIWANMKSRCNNPNASHYEYYGGKGIKICEEWHDFKAFQIWAANNGYSDGLTIDRIDNDKDYCPDNCRWITKRQQASNKSNNQKVSYLGKTMTIAEWSNETKLSYYALIQRFHLGWDSEKMFNTPVAG